MGNRKKSRFERGKVDPKILDKMRISGDFGPNMGLPDTDKLAIDPIGIAMAINAPRADKVVYAEKPAVVFQIDGDQSTKTEIGTAYIYEDGTVDIIVDEDAPQWAKDKISGNAGEYGYTIGAKLDE